MSRTNTCWTKLLLFAPKSAPPHSSPCQLTSILATYKMYPESNYLSPPLLLPPWSKSPSSAIRGITISFWFISLLLPWTPSALFSAEHTALFRSCPLPKSYNCSLRKSQGQSGLSDLTSLHLPLLTLPCAVPSRILLEYAKQALPQCLCASLFPQLFPKRTRFNHLHEVSCYWKLQPHTYPEPSSPPLILF